MQQKKDVTTTNTPSIHRDPVPPSCTCVARALPGKPTQNHRYLRNADGKTGSEAGTNRDGDGAGNSCCGNGPYLDGKTRQWYSRSDGKGIIFIIDCNDVADARLVMEGPPLSKEELVDYESIPMASLAPLGILPGSQTPRQ
jgi:hypothetical protein